MSVIVELTLPADAFELGQILRVEGPTRVTLETMVPLGGRATPFVRVRNDARSSFETHVRGHASVSDLHSIDSHGAETLYALAWEPSAGSLFDTIREMDATLLEATGGPDVWRFELRFPTHETLSAFRTYCGERDIDVTVERIYNPTPPEAGAWYGLTPPQRETLMRAVERGYYTLPRKVSTVALAEEFGISDQAVTERLRRGINTLVTNTLNAAEDD